MFRTLIAISAAVFPQHGSRAEHAAGPVSSQDDGGGEKGPDGIIFF